MVILSFNLVESVVMLLTAKLQYIVTLARLCFGIVSRISRPNYSGKMDKIYK